MKIIFETTGIFDNFKFVKYYFRKIIGQIRNIRSIRVNHSPQNVLYMEYYFCLIRYHGNLVLFEF